MHYWWWGMHRCLPLATRFQRRAEAITSVVRVCLSLQPYRGDGFKLGSRRLGLCNLGTLTLSHALSFFLYFLSFFLSFFLSLSLYIYIYIYLSLSLLALCLEVKPISKRHTKHSKPPLSVFLSLCLFSPLFPPSPRPLIPPL